MGDGVFFQSLFGDAIAENRKICIFILPDRVARHFHDAEQAVRYAQSIHDKNVYFGVGLASQNFNRRNSAQDIVAIGGLWADIDADDGTNSRPGPANHDEARRLFSRLPHYPSIIIDSGHGWHTYWIFREPWIFAGEEERFQAAALARGWVDYIATVAQHVFGWRVDHVGDLARLMRVPETKNCKRDPPATVQIAEKNDLRYDPSDFEDFCAAAKNKSFAIVDEIITAGELILRADAEPPEEKLSQLLSESPQFRATWERNRRDLIDQSQSAYDLALANIAALRGWTRQEIADLIIAARRKHQQKPEKAMRPGYVARTIAEAEHAAAEQARAAKEVDLSGIIGQKLPAPNSVVKTTETIGAQGVSGQKLPNISNDASNVKGKTLAQLLSEKHSLREPVIYGLLRIGETINIIANPKVGKSWLTLDLALALAAKKEWLGFPTSGGNVLLADNELHEETIAHRIPRVAEARGIDISEVATKIHIISLRGHLSDIFSLRQWLGEYAPGFFRMIVLDSFYRFFPAKIDENDNAAMANLYNFLDRIADEMQCSFAVVHHASKGSQAHKDITDVGAGAGSMARAVDTHLILRRHQEDGAVVMEAAARTWPPIAPRCLRWQYPVWVAADDLDPHDLLSPMARQRRSAGAEKKNENIWTPADFVARFVGARPKSLARICEDAGVEGISTRRVTRLIELAEEEKLIFRWRLDATGKTGYATEAQPEEESQNDSKRAAVEALLKFEPRLSTGDIAKRCGVSWQYANRVRLGR